VSDLQISRGSVQDRPPNFYADDGRLYLVRCFVCGGEHGRENWAPAVADGTCAWCGWTEQAATNDGEREEAER